ncbi:glucan endo-1,3-beta-glucosidase 4-like protein [Tanacetum coccineum]
MHIVLLRKMNNFAWHLVSLRCINCIDISNVQFRVTGGEFLSSKPRLNYLHQITHVWLFDSDVGLLSALSDTGIEVMISVVHKEVLGIAKSPSAAASWINIHVLALKPATNVAAVAVGSEFFSSNPNAGPVLVIAINNLYKA